MIEWLYLNKLKEIVGDRLEQDVLLSRYTAARIGGPADIFVTVRSVDELVATMEVLWQGNVPVVLIGGGSNILVSDAGVRGVVVFNRAQQVHFLAEAEPPVVWAESGANLGLVARQAALRGLSGLEWGAGIPGTLGGAVFGNAGAHDGDTAGNLVVAEILHKNRGRETWYPDQFEFGYRTSTLKKSPGEIVVLTVTLQLMKSTPEKIQEKMESFLERRRRTQPPGASMGSMFKNPPGDYAGRLIEAAGLKGTRVGDAQISPLHGNFFMNLGQATANDVRQLICLAQEVVQEKFGVKLELEIELVGVW